MYLVNSESPIDASVGAMTEGIGQPRIRNTTEPISAGAVALSGLYKPWYFTPYYAIHGSKSVPARPASHGCVRVPTWESNHLDDLLEIGLPVHIWEA